MRARSLGPLVKARVFGMTPRTGVNWPTTTTADRAVTREAPPFQKRFIKDLATKISPTPQRGASFTTTDYFPKITVLVKWPLAAM